MKVKEKIVIKAIELFNEKGIALTTQGQIAKALGISPGNLTYHFKTKESLVKAVYEKMHEDSKDFISISGYLTLYDFRKIMGDFQDFIQKHGFFFQDLFLILQSYPEVGKLYEGSNRMRLEQGKALFKYYVETDRMIPETAGLNYNFLTHNVWMVGAFWNFQSKIFTSEPIFNQPMDVVEMTWYMLLPYLTEKGKAEYQQINEFLEKQSGTLIQSPHRN